MKVAKGTDLLQFFRSYSQISFLVCLAGGKFDVPVVLNSIIAALLPQFAQEKMCENGYLYSSSQRISKANLVTLKDFLETVSTLVWIRIYAVFSKKLEHYLFSAEKT